MIETDMRLDTPLTPEEVGLDPIDATAIINRIATMGSKLAVHEYYALMLGVGDVEIERLPLSTKVGIYSHEFEEPEIEIYIITSPDNSIRQREIFLALQKYLLPSLIGE